MFDNDGSTGTTFDRTTVAINAAGTTSLGVGVPSGNTTTVGLTDIAFNTVNISEGNASLVASFSQTADTAYLLELTGKVPFYSGDSLTGTDSNDWAVKVTLTNYIAGTTAVAVTGGTASVSPSLVGADGVFYVYGTYAQLNADDIVVTVTNDAENKATIAINKGDDGIIAENGLAVAALTIPTDGTVHSVDVSSANATIAGTATQTGSSTYDIGLSGAVPYYQNDGPAGTKYDWVVKVAVANGNNYDSAIVSSPDYIGVDTSDKANGNLYIYGKSTLTGDPTVTITQDGKSDLILTIINDGLIESMSIASVDNGEFDNITTINNVAVSSENENITVSTVTQTAPAAYSVVLTGEVPYYQNNGPATSTNDWVVRVILDNIATNTSEVLSVSASAGTSPVVGDTLANRTLYVYGTFAQVTADSVVVTVDKDPNNGTTADQITLTITGPALTKALSIASTGATTAGLTGTALGTSGGTVLAANSGVTFSDVEQTLPDIYNVTLSGMVPFYSGNSLIASNSNDWAVKFTLDNVDAGTSKVVSVNTTVGVASSSVVTLTGETLYVYGNYQSVDGATVTVVLDRDGSDVTTSDQITIMIDSESLNLAMVAFNTETNLVENTTEKWAGLTSYSSYTASYTANTVTIAGEVPFYATAQKIDGDTGSTLTDHNIWAFYVALNDLRIDSDGIIVTPTNCVATIDYTSKRLYVAGTADQIFSGSDITVEISGNAPDHDAITLTIVKGDLTVDSITLANAAAVLPVDGWTGTTVYDFAEAGNTLTMSGVIPFYQAKPKYATASDTNYYAVAMSLEDVNPDAKYSLDSGATWVAFTAAASPVYYTAGAENSGEGTLYFVGTSTANVSIMFDNDGSTGTTFDRTTVVINADATTIGMGIASTGADNGAFNNIITVNDVAVSSENENITVSTVTQTFPADYSIVLTGEVPYYYDNGPANSTNDWVVKVTLLKATNNTSKVTSVGGGVTTPVDADGVFYVYGTAGELAPAGSVVVTVDKDNSDVTTNDRITLTITGPALTKAMGIASTGATTAGLTGAALGTSGGTVLAANSGVIFSDVEQTLPDIYNVTLSGMVPFYSGNSLTGTNSNDWVVKFTLGNVVADTSKVVSVNTTAGVASTSVVTLTGDTLYVYGNYQSVDGATVTVVLDRDGSDATTADQITIKVDSEGLTYATLAFSETIYDGENGVLAIHSDWNTALTSNAPVRAAISVNEVTVSGTVPYYTDALELSDGFDIATATGHNIFAFSVDLTNVGTGAAVTSASAGCAAIIDSGRLYIACNAEALFATPTVVINNNVTGHSSITLTIEPTSATVPDVTTVSLYDGGLGQHSSWTFNSDTLSASLTDGVITVSGVATYSFTTDVADSVANEAYAESVTANKYIYALYLDFTNLDTANATIKFGADAAVRIGATPFYFAGDAAALTTAGFTVLVDNDGSDTTTYDRYSFTIKASSLYLQPYVDGDIVAVTSGIPSGWANAVNTPEVTPQSITNTVDQANMTFIASMTAGSLAFYQQHPYDGMVINDNIYVVKVKINNVATGSTKVQVAGTEWVDAKTGNLYFIPGIGADDGYYYVIGTGTMNIVLDSDNDIGTTNDQVTIKIGIDGAVTDNTFGFGTFAVTAFNGNTDAVNGVIASASNNSLAVNFVSSAITLSGTVPYYDSGITGNTYTNDWVVKVPLKNVPTTATASVSRGSSLNSSLASATPGIDSKIITGTSASDGYFYVYGTIDCLNIGAAGATPDTLQITVDVDGNSGTTGDQYTITLAGSSLIPAFATTASPYQVANAAQLNHVRNGLALSYTQIQNIDIAAYCASTAGWTPIGDATTGFSGTYNGGTKTISNLMINSTGNNIGLFGQTSGGSIGSLSLEVVSVTGNSYVGTLVGYNAATIERCSVTGVDGNVATLTAGVADSTAYAGGLIGYTSADISNCYSELDVTSAKNYLGGLVGQAPDNTIQIQYCYTTGNVISTGMGRCGGITGAFGTITNCVALGDIVKGTNTNVGRIRARPNEGVGVKCYANKDMIVKDATVTSTDPTSKDGADVTLDVAKLYDSWTNDAYWSGSAYDTDIWDIATGSYPVLKKVP